MADAPAKTPLKPAPGADARRDRLREALRDNLKRRKAQLRGRNELSDRSPSSDDSPDCD